MIQFSRILSSRFLLQASLKREYIPKLNTDHAVKKLRSCLLESLLHHLSVRLICLRENLKIFS
ncbi:hypothetical protein HZS_3388 [Henneguya salminicola]|nr:hypothetical protein HZS_3388 [Henneguya salminicola]